MKRNWPKPRGPSPLVIGVVTVLVVSAGLMGGFFVDCSRIAATRARQADYLNPWGTPEPTPGYCDVIGSWP